MTRLILTSNASAAGALMGASPGDLAIAIERRLVWGPLLSGSQSEAFFAAHTSQGQGLHWLDDTPSWRLEEFGAKGLGLIDLCAKWQSVELWIDPVPNSQLILLWLLDYWRPKARVAPRLVMRDVDFLIGATERTRLEKLDVPAVEISSDHLAAASLAWQAYRAPTPQAWFNLLSADLGLLPQLASCVLELLEELPGRGTGVGATETRMLELISQGGRHPFDVFPGHEKPNRRRVFNYWEAGTLLDGLARCPVPAVSGLDEGPFSLEMHKSEERHDRYKQSRLALAELGRAVLAGEEDFSRHNPTDCWWGGTRMTNDRLWRWDTESRSLVAP